MHVLCSYLFAKQIIIENVQILIAEIWLCILLQYDNQTLYNFASKSDILRSTSPLFCLRKQLYKFFHLLDYVLCPSGPTYQNNGPQNVYNCLIL